MNLKESIKKYFFKSKLKQITVGSLNEISRITWLEKVLREIPAGSKILDAGAGEQPFKSFCNHLQYVSQDFAQYSPEKLDSGLQMQNWDYGQLDIISDIASIPQEKESFDAIMCTEVLEHIINPRETIAEFSRLLKSEGYLIITAPFCSLTHFAPYHFYSGFNKFFYEEELNNNGFHNIEIITNGSYFDYLAQEMNRLPFMSTKYSNININKKESKTISQLKLLLQKLSDNDSNSSELLCFGYHIRARKK